jgi:hypothetical protein
MILNPVKPCGLIPPIRRSGAGWIVGLALTMLAPAACAAGLPLAGENSARSALIAHACTTTMGFSAGTVDYSDCVASLSKSAAASQQARALQDARAECADRALKEGTPDFALCVLDREQPRP